MLFLFLNFYSPWNYQETVCLIISGGMKTIQNLHKIKSETCWIESPKRKRYEFDTNFLKHKDTTAELLPLWQTGPLCTFLHNCLSVAIHSNVTTHSLTQVNFFIIHM